jgi:hypothetical protein
MYNQNRKKTILLPINVIDINYETLINNLCLDDNDVKSLLAYQGYLIKQVRIADTFSEGTVFNINTCSEKSQTFKFASYPVFTGNVGPSFLIRQNDEQINLLCFVNDCIKKKKRKMGISRGAHTHNTRLNATIFCYYTSRTEYISSREAHDCILL